MNKTKPQTRSKQANKQNTEVKNRKTMIETNYIIYKVVKLETAGKSTEDVEQLSFWSCLTILIKVSILNKSYETHSLYWCYIYMYLKKVAREVVANYHASLPLSP